MSSDTDNRKEMSKHLRNGNPEDQGVNWRLWAKNLSGVAACLASSFFKGPVPATSRYVIDRGYTPYQMLFLDDLLIFLVALSITVYQRIDMLPKGWRHGVHLIFLGCARFTSVICLFTAFQFIPPATAEAVWNASMPVFVVTLSCIFLQQIPTRVTILGSMWCVAGVVLLGYGSFVNMTSSADTTDVTLGQILAVTGALIHSMLDVGAKNILETTPRAKAVMYTYALSTLSAGIGAFVTSSTWQLEPVTATVLVLSCCSHGVGMMFFYIGLKLVEVNAVTALIQLSAFPAYGVQWAMLGFAPTVLDGVGLSCVLIGAFSIVIWEALVSWKEQNHLAFIGQLDFNVTKPNGKP
ncbi:uncharacterized protein LOC118426541 [Branchiostoma floridae]|uniref:Uncharacterized protein LOC118426541 n=1 Tax=Branchiostoma floridae TaxID=7739 RepID=A0A9J7M0N3_BRAFL|nr:uncharacterized protein LOC118426541 [Branchiostoma floridae]